MEKKDAVLQYSSSLSRCVAAGARLSDCCRILYSCLGVYALGTSIGLIFWDIVNVFDGGIFLMVVYE